MVLAEKDLAPPVPMDPRNESAHSPELADVRREAFLLLLLVGLLNLDDGSLEFAELNFFAA